MQPNPKIKVVGIGGSGSNTISRMVKDGIQGIDLIAVNTDAQALRFCKAEKKVLIGENVTRGLGAGMDVSLGRKAAEESRKKIEEVLEGANMVFITGGMGGGCLRGNSLIHTNPEGPIRIDSITPGSTVYAFDNNRLVKRKVLAAMKTGIKKVLELKTKNRTIYASEDHPFLRVRPLNNLSDNRFSKFNLDWVELKDLRKGDLVVIVKKIPDEGKSFKVTENLYTNDNFCQLFGFLLGDGWISKSRESWKIFFSPSKNESNNKKYLDLMKEVFSLEMKRGKNWYQVGSKKVYEMLTKLGLDKHAKDKEILSWVFGLPEPQKKAFIIGLADADASYSVQIGRTGLPKKEIKFEMASEKLIRQLKALCDGIGLRTSNVNYRKRFIKAPNSKKADWHEFWSLRIYKTHELLGTFVHPKVRSGENFLYKFRSRKTPDFLKSFGFNRVESIKNMGEEEVYDITVEGSHNFIADGFVVHNTGSGASPIIAEVSKSLGILTIAVVTKPFSFEGEQRKKVANSALEKLRDRVDALLVISNDKLLCLVDDKTTVNNAFWICDEVLREAVQGITDLVVLPGIVTVDMASILAIMKNAGTALFGVGKSRGENRAVEAAQKAINSPLLDSSIAGAKRVLFNVSGQDLGLAEVSEVAKIITKTADPKAQVIFGAINDPKLKKGEIKVTVIAAGF